jgi:hypothetical protein
LVAFIWHEVPGEWDGTLGFSVVVGGVNVIVFDDPKSRRFVSTQRGPNHLLLALLPDLFKAMEGTRGCTVVGYPSHGT